jgi:hypothetical protein
MSEKVVCEVCKKELYTIAPLHLKTHGLTMAEYHSLYPNAEIHSDTIKRHIGIGSLGNKYSLGIHSPRKGKTLTEIVGIERAIEIRSKISKNRKGITSKSEARKITMNTPEFKARMSAIKKQQLTEHPEIAIKQSESLKASYASGKTVHWATGLTSKTDERIRLKTIKHGDAIRGIKMPEMQRLAMCGENHPMFGKTYEEIYPPEEAKRLKQARSDTIQRLIRDPEYVKKHLGAMKLKPNKKEVKLGEIINNVSSDYRFNGDYRLGVSFDGLIPDYWNINGQKKVIELLGDYWHGEKMRKHSKETEEQTKIERYAKCGIKCLLIWEHELRSPETVKVKIKEFNLKGGLHETVV